jgi:hypothetical protein
MVDGLHSGHHALVDPWDCQEPADNPPAPCRTIVVTEAMRARDAAQRAAREHSAASDWKIKVELSEENLRIVRRDVGPHRQEARPVIVTRTPKPKVPRVPANRRSCGRCGEPLHGATRGEICRRCQRTGRTRECPGGCGGWMVISRGHELCRNCRNAAAKLTKAEKVRRRCACGRGLKGHADRETCSQCFASARRKERVLKARVRCENPECDRLLRGRRTSGLCHRCWKRTAEGTRARTARYRERRIAKAGTRCVVCGVPIKWTTKTGRCNRHASALRASRTILHAATLDEHVLNELWSQLSYADKLAVLGDSLKTEAA